MKILRILSLFLALLMLVSAFAACGGDPAETTGGDKKPTENGRDEIADTVPLDLNYSGETVTFLVRGNAEDIFKYELACEKLLNDPLYDAIHYRNIDVETRLGLKIRTVEQPGTWDDQTAWCNTLSTSVLTNTGDYDGAAFYLSTGAGLAKDGIYYNLFSLTKDEGGYLDFEKPWWNQSMTDELGIFGTLFFAGSSLTVSQAQNTSCVFFNRDLFNEKYPDDRDVALYQLVRDGKWTIDKMTDYVANCWDDLNSNGVADNGDVVGIRSLGNAWGGMDAWIYAMGLDITKNNAYGEPELVLVNGKTIPAYEKVRALFNNEGGLIIASAAELGETDMPNGNLLFIPQVVNYGKSMKESTVNYGVLPVPKYDEEQETYRTCFGNVASALAVCSNLSDSRAAMVSAVLEVLSAESYKQVIPVYYGTVLKGHYSREQADAEMYDRILDTAVFSFGFAYSTSSLGSISAIFRRLQLDYDIQNYIDSNKDVWEQKLTDLLLALEEVA